MMWAIVVTSIVAFAVADAMRRKGNRPECTSCKSKNTTRIEGVPYYICEDCSTAFRVD